MRHLMPATMLLVSTFAGVSLAQDSSNSAETPAVIVVTQPPLTRLDTFEATPGVVIVKSSDAQTAMGGDDGNSLTVVAVRLTIAGGNQQQAGIAIQVTQRGGAVVSAYVDEEDLPAFIDGLDALAKIDRKAGTMDHVDAAYHVGNVCVANHDDNGREAVVRVVHYAPITGQVAWASARFRGVRLSEIRNQVIAAQAALSKDGK